VLLEYEVFDGLVGEGLLAEVVGENHRLSAVPSFLVPPGCDGMYVSETILRYFCGLLSWGEVRFLPVTEEGRDFPWLLDI